MKKETLVKQIKLNVFTTKDTINDALLTADSLIKDIDKKHQWLAYMALHVVMNTIAQEVERIDK